MRFHDFGLRTIVATAIYLTALNVSANDLICDVLGICSHVKTPGATFHFYTVNVAERNNAIQRLKWIDEGEAGYVPATSSMETVQLKRWRAPAPNPQHFYSKSTLPPEGYVSEEYCCFVFRDLAPGLVPLRHFYNKISENNFYTTSDSEPKTLGHYERAADEGYISPTQRPGFIPLYRLKIVLIGYVE